MSLDFGSKDRVLGLWFGAMPGKDFLACAWIPTGKEEIKLVWRVRDHHSEDPWDEQDEKRWYEGARPGISTKEQEDCIKTCDFLFSGAAEQFGFTDLDKIGPGSGEEIMAILETKPWCHIRRVPDAAKEEVEAAMAGGKPLPNWNKIRN